MQRNLKKGIVFMGIIYLLKCENQDNSEDVMIIEIEKAGR
jgi:hypothetical protein